jgi:siroheme decarboxylase
VGSVTPETMDAPLLAAAQTQLPLVRQPFAALARATGTSHRRVIEVLRRARTDGRLRRIGGIFEARALGYTSALLAFDVEDVVTAGTILATHPGTSHVYERLGPSCYTLWATLAVSTDSSLGLQATAHRLATQTAARDVQVLPAIKRYKLDARFGGIRPPAPISRQTTPIDLTSADRQLIRLLQHDLPITPRPFDSLARQLGIETAALLARARELRSAGILRRIAAVANHRRLGAIMNVMVVWSLTGNAADRAGVICSASPSVSHCFLRQAPAAWPYGFYAMIHGATQKACRDTIEDLSDRIGGAEGLALWTGREFKKSPVTLFDPAEAEWERASR